MGAPHWKNLKPLPAAELVGRRFTVRCAQCARCKVLRYDEFMAWAKPKHRNEYVDEIEQRIRCAPAREAGRACPVKISYELKLT